MSRAIIIEDIKSAFYAFQEIKKDFKKSGVSIAGELVDGYKEFIDDTNSKVGDILLTLNTDSYRYFRDDSGTRWFHSEGISVHVNRNFGKLKSKFESVVSKEKSPFIDELPFAFIVNDKLREIAKRDFKELQIATLSKSWKSMIVLSGGVLEAILLDLLLRDEDGARK